MTAAMTPGKMRGLDTLATDEGVFAILAIDHRDSLRVVLPGEAADTDIVQFKLDLLSGVGSIASGCLLYTSPSPRDQRGSRMPSSA